ncbi:response regulator [Paenibacillus sp. S150]|uniref:response regulator n=1 Tax=Paenibacillus sp. S150 TaxID=2749826 RepID=UPI001C5616E7|nr:response regulator [Paenibacillus sp. S150]MBW4081141.1 response regulator [Paenibacillus sp. S150]
MFRLLVVDDEMIIADGLHEVLQGLPELELDVYKAYSGEEAVRLFDRTRFDIVLTDIRMPGISGLQLLDRIRERWPTCKVIFLTGHNEFSYIYSAIQYDGVSYLLKTEGYGKVIQLVEQSVREIETEMKAETLLKQAQEQLDTTRELRQNDYIKGLLNEQLNIREINQKQLDELGIPLRSDKSVLILLGRVNSFQNKSMYAYRTSQLYRIKLIARQYISVHAVSVETVNEQSDLIWFIQPLPGQAAEEEWGKLLTYIKGNLELIQLACRESVGEVLSFVLDDSPVSWEQAAGRFSVLEMMMNYRIGQGSGMLLLDKQLIRQEMLQAEKPGTRRISLRHSRLELLGDQLEHGQREEFGKTLQECASAFAAVDSMHYTPAMEVYYAIGLVFLTYMNRWNLVDTAAAKAGLHKLMQPGEHPSWQEAFGYLIQVGELLFSLQSQEEARRAKAVVTIIQKHILEHLHDPDETSLVRLAELVYFNPSYLSRLFKQVTEINLSEYITGARMGKAKQLLGNPDIKIQEVAELVGYGTATNFTRSFRKSMNMTPQEYRSLVLSR